MSEPLDEAEQAYEDGFTAGRRAGFKELTAARAQIAGMDAEIEQLKHRCRQLDHDLTWALEQIAAKDAALDALDEAHQITQQNLWQDITELRASLADKEQEHQDFRLQNDAEWRAKLDHLKAQIAAKDADLAVLVPCVRASVEYFGKDDADKALLAALHRQEAALNALRRQA